MLNDLSYCPSDERSLPFWLLVDQFFFGILAGKEDNHKISDEFEIRPDSPMDHRVSSPRAFEKKSHRLLLKIGSIATEKNHPHTAEPADIYRAGRYRRRHSLFRLNIPHLLSVLNFLEWGMIRQSIHTFRLPNT